MTTRGDLRSLDLAGRKVIVRVDFNVPLDQDYQITDDTRIRGALPTIQYLLEQHAAVILLSHLGRPLAKLLPDGSINKPKFTLRHLLPRLSSLLNRPVGFCEETVGPQAMAAVQQLNPGEVLLMENTRFYPGEEKGDPDLAKSMAALGEVYINDAFGAAHRTHASTAVIARHFDTAHRAFGFLMQRELDSAKHVLEQPKRPFVAILGGAKVSDKILLIEALLDKADTIIIGGGMAYTFIRAQGGQTGNSLVEEDKLELAKALLTKAASMGKTIALPADSIAADKFDPAAQVKNVLSHEIPEGWMGLDIGFTARFEYDHLIQQAGTILWNGPMGVFEMEPFAQGTNAIADSVAKATKEGAFSLVGGGDSVAAVEKAGLAHAISFISTGGGAMLELLEGKVLPGVAAILAE